MNDKSLGAIILAAGKGIRMQATKINKVVYPLANRPMILHTVELLESLKMSSIIVVVGFAKESVIDVLQDHSVTFAEQPEQLGVANALSFGVEKIPDEVQNVLVVNGDDSALYAKDLLEKLIDRHLDTSSALTLLTIQLLNPFGLGRIIRDKNGEVIRIVEEKDATDEERKIQEINTGCYIFRVDFLKRYLHKIEKSKATGEYYLTDLIELAAKNNEKITSIKGNNIKWRGVNTQAELDEAEKLFSSNI